MSKASAVATLILIGTIGIAIGMILGIIIFSYIQPVREVEIAPKSPANALDFYVDYLRSLNYTVVEKELRVNDYRTVQNFNEFLWILKTANITECYFDHSYPLTLFTARELSKLWIQFDGIYWELRFQ
jgi:hypothetical protein